jgi:hypothetical protein
MTVDASYNGYDALGEGCPAPFDDDWSSATRAGPDAGPRRELDCGEASGPGSARSLTVGALIRRYAASGASYSSRHEPEFLLQVRPPDTRMRDATCEPSFVGNAQTRNFTRARQPGQVVRM